MKYVLVTGYKPNELGIFNTKHPGIPYIKKAIERKIVSLIEEGLEWVMVTGLPGVSYWTTDVVVELKKTYPQLKLAVVEAYIQKLEDEKLFAYQEMLAKADYKEVLIKTEYTSPQQLKHHNKTIVAKSDAMILLYDDEKEGSPKYILEIAKKREERENYPILRITQYDLQDIVEEEQDQLRSE